jgi:hypothetical protein
MARGSDYIEGWPAIGWVAGTGAVMLLGAAILWWASRGAGRGTAHATYRTTASSDPRDERRGLAIVLLAVCGVTQLLYIKLYIDLVRWLLGARERPQVFVHILFWVVLANITCAGGALYTGLRAASAERT